MLVKKIKPWNNYWFTRVRRLEGYGGKKTVCSYYKCPIGMARNHDNPKCDACHARNYGPEDRMYPEYKEYYYIYYKEK